MGFQDKMSKEGSAWRYAEESNDGRIRLSIIAGDGAYSTPREMRTTPHEYAGFEIAVLIDGDLHLDSLDGVPGYQPWLDPMAYVPVLAAQEIVDQFVSAYVQGG